MNLPGFSSNECPRLRAGTSFRKELFQGEPRWVLEESVSGNFFRVGDPERRFLESLGGRRTVQEILTSKDDPTPPQHRAELLVRAKQAGLLEESDAPSPKPAVPFPNLLFARIPLGNPDRFVEAAGRFLAPIFSPLGLTLLGLAAIAGFYQIAIDWPRFEKSLGDVFSLANAPAILVVFVLLKLVHEMAHGIVCHRLGGHISEWGLYLIFFFPLTYVDATSVWRFPIKSQRIAVSSAGMAAEIIVAGFAGLLWAASDEGLVRTLCANTILLATVTTVLFNANPLMRYDGYFILSDLLEMPNLYQRASTAASRLLGACILGIGPLPRESAGITLYGVGCFLWRTMIVLTVCVAAIAILHGPGIVLAALAVAAMFLPRLKVLRRKEKSSPAVATPWRWYQPVAVAAAVGAILFLPLVAPGAFPGVTRFEQLSPVRVKCPGFVSEVLVRNGDQVKTGDPLFVLSNPPERARVARLETLANRSEALALSHGQAERLQLRAQEAEKARGLAAQAREAEKYLQTLNIEADRNGEILAANLNELLGTFQPSGTEIAAIGSPDAIEVLAAIPQAAGPRLPIEAGGPAEIYLPGRNLELSGTITAHDQSATRKIRSPALAATKGGPLVTRIPRRTDEEEVFVEPVIYVTIKPENAPPMREGEPAVVRLPSSKRTTLWNVISSAVEELWEDTSRKRHPLDEG